MRVSWEVKALEKCALINESQDSSWEFKTFGSESEGESEGLKPSESGENSLTNERNSSNLTLDASLAK